MIALESLLAHVAGIPGKHAKVDEPLRILSRRRLPAFVWMKLAQSLGMMVLCVLDRTCTLQHVQVTRGQKEVIKRNGHRKRGAVFLQAC